MSRHISEITTKAHQRANCIQRSFTSGDEDLLIRAFVVYVRPIVEYNSIIWSPHSKHDIDTVEKVQRRFTKRLRSLKHLSYDEQLAKQLSKFGLFIVQFIYLCIELIVNNELITCIES